MSCTTGLPIEDVLAPPVLRKKQDGWCLAWAGNLHYLKLWELAALKLGVSLEARANKVWPYRKQMIANAKAKMKEESPGAFLQRVGADGALWAAEFHKMALALGYPPMDVGWLIGWFCNAVEAGRSHERWRIEADMKAWQGAMRKYLEAQASLVAAGVVEEMSERINGAQGLVGAILHKMVKSAFDPSNPALSEAAE
jgi:hypothetical protein